MNTKLRFCTLFFLLFALFNTSAQVHGLDLSISDRPLSVTSTNTSVSIRVRPERDALRYDSTVQFIAIKKGDFEDKLKGLTLINPLTLEETKFGTSDELAEAYEALKKRKTVTLTDLGFWRNVRILAVHSKLDQKINLQNQTYLIKEFELEIEFQDQAAHDSVELPKNTREFLEGVVVNPEQLASFAVQRPQPTELEYESWHSSEAPNEWDQQTAYAIRSTDEGILGIDGRWLAQTEWSGEDLFPADLIVWSRGEEVKTILLGDAQRSFARGSRLAFLAQRNDSEYSNERVYYIGKRGSRTTFPEVKQFTSDTTTETKSVFRRQQLIEQDNELKTKLGNFLAVEQMTWVWSAIDPIEKTEWTFDLPSLAYPINDGKLLVSLYQSGGGLTGNATFEVTLNDQVIESELSVTRQTEQIELQVPEQVLKSYGNVLAFRPLTDLSSITNHSLYLDSISAEYDSFFRGDDGQFHTTLIEDNSFTQLEPINFRNLQLVAFDIQDKEDPQLLSVFADRQESKVFGQFERGTELLLIETDRIPRVPVGEEVTSQSFEKMELLAKLQDHSKLIISHENFLKSANKLADETDGVVIDSREIYHAYNGGELSPVAIRHFLRDAVAQSKLSDVILFGDCTKDGQRISKNEALNFIPTMNLPENKRGGRDPFASDVYYSWLMGDDEISDIFLGRISVNSEVDAEAVVEKILSYQNQSVDDYSNRAYFISDGGVFTETTDLLLENSNSTGYQIEHLSTDDLIWEDNFYLPDGLNIRSIQKVSPVATSRIAEAFNQGQGLIHYMGHGSPNIWSNQRIWFGGDSENSDNLRLTNKGKLPFLLSFTCNNGAIDYPLLQWNVTIIEDMIRVDNGGIVGAFVPSGPGFPTHHYWMSKGALRGIDSVPNATLGQISEAGRLYYQAIFGDTNHSRMFLLLGDPSLELKHEKKASNQQTEPTDRTGFVLHHAEIDDASQELVLAFEKQTSGSSTVQLRVDYPYSQDNFDEVFESKLKNDETYQMIRQPLGRLDPIIRVTLLNSKSTTAQNHDDYDRLLIVQNPEAWGDDPPLFWVDGTLQDSTRKNQGPRLLIVYQAEKKEGYQLKVIATVGDEVVTKNLPSSPSSSFMKQEIILPVMDLSTDAEPIKIELISSANDGSESISLGEQIVQVDPTLFPDLAFEEESISVFPNHTVDGASIFLSGRVINNGKSMSSPTSVELYFGELNLKPFANHPRSQIPSLQPGESTPFEVRWDADKVRELTELSIVIDHDDLLLETNKSNNRYTVPINLKSKWKLMPAGIRLTQTDEPGIIELTATIANVGESDAQRVTVVFFSSDEQTEKFELGEVLVDSVPSSSRKDVSYRWDIRKLDPELRVQPSYYIALKGSMQRISSVTGEE